MRTTMPADIKSARELIIGDKERPLQERVSAYKEMRSELLNPRKDFNPDTFDPYDDAENYDVVKRERKEPNRRLPTMGMKPKEIMEGQMIGMYESKQDLYLLIAWLSERVSDLEDQLSNAQRRL